jgi:hypothetical protein
MFVGPESRPYCKECEDKKDAAREKRRMQEIADEYDMESIERTHRRMWAGGTDYGDINDEDDEENDYDD